MVSSNDSSYAFEADGNALDEALFGVTRIVTFSGPRALTSATGFFLSTATDFS